MGGQECCWVWTTYTVQRVSWKEWKEHSTGALVQELPPKKLDSPALTPATVLFPLILGPTEKDCAAFTSDSAGTPSLPLIQCIQEQGSQNDEHYLL